MSNVIDFMAKKMGFHRRDLLDAIMKQLDGLIEPGAAVLEAVHYSMDDLAKKMEPYGSAHVFLRNKMVHSEEGAYWHFYLYHLPPRPLPEDSYDFDVLYTEPFMTFKFVDLPEGTELISEEGIVNDIDHVAQVFADFSSAYNVEDIWAANDVFIEFVESQMRLMPIVKISSADDCWTIRLNYHNVTAVDVTFNAKVVQDWTQALYDYHRENEE